MLKVLISAVLVGGALLVGVTLDGTSFGKVLDRKGDPQKPFITVLPDRF